MCAQSFQGKVCPQDDSNKNKSESGLFLLVTQSKWHDVCILPLLAGDLFTTEMKQLKWYGIESGVDGTIPWQKLGN